MKKNRFGETLKKLRAEGKYTQGHIGRLINTDRSNVANYESGKRMPPIESLVTLAEFFGVSLGYLILGINKRYVKREESTPSVENLQGQLDEKKKEIKVLKGYITSFKKHNLFLEKKINKIGAIVHKRKSKSGLKLKP